MTFDPLAFISKHVWTFAKTRPQNPHEYIVRRRVQDDEGFDAFVRFIRENGKTRVWGRQRYLVWYGPDGHHYWTMGWPVAETTIINRANSEEHDQTKDWFPYLGYPWSSPDGERPQL